MDKKQITKKQHYISQGLLRLFSNDGIHLYECMIPQQKVYRTKISDAMEENYTYEHPLLEDNALENAFASIEGEFIPQIVALERNVLASLKFTNEVYSQITSLLEIFLLFYYRSGAVLSEFSYGINDLEAKKQRRVRRLLEVVTTRSYLKELANSIRKGYKCALLYSSTGQFVISDQYIATVALAYKNHFFDTSNRAIGMKETMILLPLSRSLYFAFFNGNAPNYIIQNQICELNDSETYQINKLIFHNSFKKCAGPNSELLCSLQKEQYYSFDVNQVFFGKGLNGICGYINKKEIFMYSDDEDIYTHYIHYAMEYRSLLNKHGKAHIRNIKCPCGSGKKFKICCLSKYSHAFQSVKETQKPELQNYKITGGVSEMPIYQFWHNCR